VSKVTGEEPGGEVAAALTRSVGSGEEAELFEH
jgi:hypothetical protein